MAYISDSMWQKYAGILREFHNDAMQEDIVWRRTYVTRTVLGNETRSDEVIIKGLVQYNYFRNWPINDMDVTGEIDKESVLLYLNQDYLAEEGHLNANDQFKFDAGYDRFFIEGIEYKSSGESKAAQAKDRTLFVFIILQREELVNTNEER